jgi:hypothetical protein
MTLQTLNNTRELAQQLRVDSVRCTTAAASRPLLRDVHRGAAARRRRRRPVRPRIHPVRRHLRRVLHLRLRLRPDVGYLPGEHPAVRLPRRRRDRRGWPVADGPGRSRDDAGRARLHGLVPQRRDEYRKPGGGIGSAVLEAFNDAGHPVRISHLAVRDLPGSGTPEELMKAAGISADRIAEAAREVLSA